MLAWDEVASRIARVSGLHQDLHGLLGDRAFDELALEKLIALRRKLDRLDLGVSGAVCLGHNLRHAVPVEGRRHYVHLASDFLNADRDPVPPGSVVLLLNNDIGRSLPAWMEWSARRSDCLHVVWDWDSQHWLQMSCTLAAASDFYIPSTSENVYTLSHFTPNLLGPAFAAVNQWPRQFVVDHMELLLAERRDEPFGPHVRYERFARRNRAITTLGQRLPGISFADNGYQRKSDLDNLQEWARYKTHWIIPVLGGVPIRVYNALLTGGIALLPSHVRAMPETMLVGTDAEFYDVIDLVEPATVQRRAVERFDGEGRVGTAQRIGRALERHHIDTRCEQVLRAVDGARTRIRGLDTSIGSRYLMSD